MATLIDLRGYKRKRCASTLNDKYKDSSGKKQQRLFLVRPDLIDLLLLGHGDQKK